MDPKTKAGNNKKSKKKKKERSPRAKFIFMVLKILTILFVAVMCAAAGILGGAIYGYIKTTPALTDEQLQIKNFTTVLYDDSGTKQIASLVGSENRVWVYDKDIPQYLKDAFVALEDERFYTHKGIDPQRILGVTFNLLKSGQVQGGASTITQQVIKNLTNEKEVTLQRKVQEQWRAIQLENKLQKWQILELYMNLIYMGYNTNGVQTASKLYFDKDVKDLSLAQCASLAGITNGPALYDPFTEKGRENNIKRQQACLKLMLEQGYITQTEYDSALKEDLHFKQGNIDELNKASTQSYFVDQVVLDIKKDLKEKYNMSDQLALKSIYNNGYTIYTTMDAEAQAAMDETFKNESLFPKANINSIVANNKGLKQSEIDAYKKTIANEHPQAAMVVIDPQKEQVKALYGGFGEKTGGGLNRATQINRQVGSSFKPLADYGPAIDQRLITAATVIDDAPVHLDNQHPDALYPQNFTRNYAGLTTVRDAIANSVNVVAAKVYLMNPDIAYPYLNKVGINRDNERTVSFSLGGLEVGLSPFRMTAAYTPFVDRGMYSEPITYTKVVDRDGNVILENKKETTIVYNETSAYIMNDMMQSVVRYGTAYPNGIITNAQGQVIPTGGKTGTTSDDKDRWYVGFSPYYVSAVWYGYDTPVPLDGLSSNPSLRIWRDVMLKLHKDKPFVSFQEPAGLVKKTICIYSGKIATDLCSQDPRNSTRGSVRYNELFIKGTEPSDTDYCDVHVKAKVDISSKDAFGRAQLAGPYCPLDLIEERVFVKRREPYVQQSPNDPYPLDWAYELPTETCTIHSAQSFLENPLGIILPDIPDDAPASTQSTQSPQGTQSTQNTDEFHQVDGFPSGGSTNPTEPSTGGTTAPAASTNGQQ